MVLTNFECWAHGGAAAGGDAGAGIGLPFGAATAAGAHHMDIFNPHAVNGGATAPPPPPVSHISSNGYYGFSYVNAAHEAVGGEQHPNNNNNNNRCVPNANDVNGIATMHNSDVNGGAAAAAVTYAGFGNGASQQRCKKRYFVSDDDYANCALLNGRGDGGGGFGAHANVVGVAGRDVRAAKRCRFDDDYAAAQYCNDFFSLPSTQIGTQSCLMDTEDFQNNSCPNQQSQHSQAQQQQQVVDGVIMMGSNNFNNQITAATANTSNLHFTTAQHQLELQLQQQQQHNQQQQLQQAQQQTLMATAPPPPSPPNQAPPAYQHQHNYQANRCQTVVDNSNSSSSTTATSDYLNSNTSSGTNNNYNLKNKTELLKPLECVVDKALMRSPSINTHETALMSTFKRNAVDADNDAIVAATLYATTHGGSLYHFTTATAANGYQQFIEDI